MLRGIKLLEYVIHPLAAPAPPSPKKTDVMVLALFMVLACVMDLTREMEAKLMLCSEHSIIKLSLQM